MDLFEVFMQDKFWESTVLKAVDKTIPTALLEKCCSSAFRVKLFDQIARGEYHISPPAVQRIPKENGEYREIFVNTPIDRLVLAVANLAYYELYEDQLSDACMAYRKGRSCAKTVRNVSANICSGYKVDLSKYFDSVPKDVLLATLAELDTCSPLDKVILEYYSSDFVKVDGEVQPRYKSLAQGCAVAAFLSNFILRHIDAKMTELCAYYCRYSDDMLLLGEKAGYALSVLTSELSKLGLRLNPAKVEAVSPDAEFRFLGFGICGNKITVSCKDLAAKKAAIKHCTKLIKSNRGLSFNDKLIKAVRTTQALFFNKTQPTYGWLYTKCVAINDLSRIEMLDNYCKDCIRACVTGSWNFTHNMHKIPEERLREAGYVSLVHMAKVAQIDRNLFNQEHMRWIRHMN